MTFWKLTVHIYIYIYIYIHLSIYRLCNNNISYIKQLLSFIIAAGEWVILADAGEKCGGVRHGPPIGIQVPHGVLPLVIMYNLSLSLYIYIYIYTYKLQSILLYCYSLDSSLYCYLLLLPQSEDGAGPRDITDKTFISWKMNIARDITDKKFIFWKMNIARDITDKKFIFWKMNFARDITDNNVIFWKMNLLSVISRGACVPAENPVVSRRTWLLGLRLQ